MKLKEIKKEKRRSPVELVIGRDQEARRFCTRSSVWSFVRFAGPSGKRLEKERRGGVVEN